MTLDDWIIRSTFRIRMMERSVSSLFDIVCDANVFVVWEEPWSATASA